MDKYTIKMIAGGKCCDKCHDVYFEKNYPEHTAHNACHNVICDCHKGVSEVPGTANCGFDCHFQEPYGFVPEAGCRIHDVPITKIAGVDFSDSLNLLAKL